ncbi:hypothetical protein ACFY1J_31005 [Streptomyces sp. NPDC001406]|uniref:hypothetical protein n=1 Tax=Streptomyces sp. NPDC001406 TaxID=3364572 RepID=UPI003690EF0C
MAKDRPWNRPEYTEPPEAFNIGDATDEEVRAYCLRRSRAFLARAETTDAAISSDRQLQIAAHYAMIAQAFRPGPAPE